MPEAASLRSHMMWEIASSFLVYMLSRHKAVSSLHRGRFTLSLTPLRSQSAGTTAWTQIRKTRVKEFDVK